MNEGVQVKSNWNVFVAVCVGAVAGFAVGQQMAAKGGGLGTTLRNAPPPAPTAENPHPRPSVVPGTFVVLVFGR